MGVSTTGLDEIEKALNTLAGSGANELSGIVVEAAAEAWVVTAQAVMGVDTGQLRARTGITFLSDTEAELQADTPYASYNSYGTRFQVGTGFWEAGQREAESLLRDFGAQYESVIGESIESGGHPRPRSLF